MKKRPLCFFSIIFVILHMLILYVFSISAYDLQEESEQNYVVGTVWYREERSTGNIYYLRCAGYKAHILAYLPNNSQYKTGDQIIVYGQVKPFESACNPGQFDEKKYYYSIGVRGKITADQSICLKKSKHILDKIRDELICLKTRMTAQMDCFLSKEHAAVFCSMLFGDGSNMEKEIKEGYRVIGLSHLLAVSGMHISFIAGGLFRGLRKIGFGYTVSCSISMIFLLCYMQMTGFKTPVMRAGIMFIIYLLAQYKGRKYDSITAYFVSAMLLCLIRPYVFYSAGGVFSYVAAFLVIVWNETELAQNIKGGPILFLCYIQAGMLPLYIVYYYEIPTFSVLWNFLLTGLFSVILVSGIIALFLSYVWTYGALFIAGTTECLLEVYEIAAQIGEKIPGSMLTCGKMQLWQMICYYIGFCFLFFRRKKENKNVLYKLIFIAGAVIMILYRPHANLEIAFLDVGQGDGIGIYTEHGEMILIDGGSTTVNEVGMYRLKPFLKYYGVKKINTVFISHGDADHISGILELIASKSVRIEKVIVSEYAGQGLEEIIKQCKNQNIPVYKMKQGNEIIIDNVQFTCLGPPEDWNGETENNRSLVLYMQVEGIDCLFTGDMEQEEEEKIFEADHMKKILSRIDVLKVAHHGSDTSTKEEMLSYVNASLAIISCGQGNRYGHPHESVLRRLQEKGMITYSTKNTGAIVLYCENGKIEQKLWNDRRVFDSLKKE